MAWNQYIITLLSPVQCTSVECKEAVESNEVWNVRGFTVLRKELEFWKIIKNLRNFEKLMETIEVLRKFWKL